MSQPTEYLTAAEAAQVLHIKPVMVGRLCSVGQLRAFKPGKTWLIRRDDLESYIEAHENTAAATA